MALRRSTRRRSALARMAFSRFLGDDCREYWAEAFLRERDVDDLGHKRPRSRTREENRCE
jgi:hypothetical protein